MEYVYMAHCNGLFKIGRAKDIWKRIKQLQTGNPHPVELWLSWEVNDARKVEAWMHEKFKEQHVRGEWYRLDDADIWRVDSIDIEGIESGRVLPHQDRPPAWWVRAFGDA